MGSTMALAYVFGDSATACFARATAPEVHRTKCSGGSQMAICFPCGRYLRGIAYQSTDGCCGSSATRQKLKTS